MARTRYRVKIRCTKCGTEVGGPAAEPGEMRLRLTIVLVDPATGRVHGPCSGCHADVVVTESGVVASGLRPRTKGTLRLYVPAD